MASDPVSVRQAVVVIHGIGEQRPMQTLREFVTTLLRPDPGASDEARFFSKPDRLTDTLELRRLASWPPHVPVPTDFYELYWAHLMKRTVWAHVVAWLQMLMLRRPWRAPASRTITLLWLVSWLAVAALVLWASFRMPLPDLQQLPAYGVWGLLGAVVLRLLGFFGLHYVGDAARYLSATPQNIEARKDIRNAVIQLLTKLHDEEARRYDRIVVVGHSLGSVIAYDALVHLWQARHSVLKDPKPLAQPELENVRRLGVDLLHKPPPARRDDEPEDERALRYRRRQCALWVEQQSIGIDWRITDLVTLGSPLAHAAFLLAGDAGEWKRMKQQRECPTAPPQAEDRRDADGLTRAISFEDSKHFDLKILHHGALFACTRWTNLFFAADPVGGRVGGVDGFGVGVADVPLEAKRWRTKWTPYAHVCYWDRRETDACDRLRRALGLEPGGEAGATGLADDEPDPDAPAASRH